MINPFRKYMYVYILMSYFCSSEEHHDIQQFLYAFYTNNNIVIILIFAHTCESCQKIHKEKNVHTDTIRKKT